MAALRQLTLYLLHACILAGLCACSAGGSGYVTGVAQAHKPQAGQPAGIIGLPAPSVLRSIKVVTSGVFRYGSQFASALPNQLATAEGNLLSFAPAWLGNGLGGAAYAVYAFDSTGYSTDDMLHLAWDTPGADFSDLWIGLANFPADRWDWFAGPSAEELPYATQKYTDNGLVYAVVLCLGSDAWKLKSIRISADVPAVVLTVSPLTCIEGVPETFTAILDGTADSYSWDFGGGADPNTSTESSPTMTPLAAGDYSATLTVTNSYGSDVFGFTLAVHLADTPPLADLAGNPLSGNAPLAVNFDASASFDPDNGGAPGAGIAKYEWDYTDDGAFDFDSAADASVQHNYTAQGTYVCRVRVTDDEGATATDTVTVTVDTALTYSVSGTVNLADAPVTGLQGVSLDLSPGGYPGTTDAGGAFSIAAVPNGDYTLTPTLAGWSFSPADLAVQVSGSDVTGRDFTAFAPPVADLIGDPLTGNAPLPVSFDASASNDPDNGGGAGGGIDKFEWDWEDDGVYDFDSGTDATVSHSYEAVGDYVCRLRVTDNESSTATATVSISVAVTFTASGYVKTSFGDGIQGVTMSFTNGLASVTTDSSGYWSRDSIPDGDYTVTPGKNGFTFDPASQDFTISGADAAVGDFTSVDLGEPNNGLNSAYELPATGDYSATIGGSDTWDCYKFTAPSAGLMKVTYSNPITDPMVGMYLSPADNGALLSAGVNHEVSAICRAGDTFYIGFNGSSLGADPPYSFTLSIETPAWSDIDDPPSNGSFGAASGGRMLSVTYRATADNSADPFDYYAYGGAQFDVGTTYDATMTYDQTTRIDYYAFRLDQTVIWGSSTVLNPKYVTWSWTMDMGGMMYFAVWVLQATPHYYTFTISPSSKRAPL